MLAWLSYLVEFECRVEFEDTERDEDGDAQDGHGAVREHHRQTGSLQRIIGFIAQRSGCGKMEVIFSTKKRFKYLVLINFD